MSNIVERLRARQGFFDRGVCVGEDTDIRKAADEIERLNKDGAEMAAIIRQQGFEIERLRAALQEIEQWSRAYPLAVFPEPDLKKAHALLEAGGMTLDAISADAMRHVVDGVFQIARRALEPKP